MWINRIGEIDKEYAQKEGALKFFKTLASINKKTDRTYYVRRGLNTMYYDLCVIVHRDKKSYDVLPLPIFLGVLGVINPKIDDQDRSNYWLSDKEQHPIFRFFSNITNEWYYNNMRQRFMQDENYNFFKKHEDEFKRIGLESLEDAHVLVFAKDYDHLIQSGEYDQYEISRGKCWYSLQTDYLDESEGPQTSQWGNSIVYPISKMYEDLMEAFNEGKTITVQ